MHLQNEIHRKAIAFFTHEFDAIIIPPFEVSNMVNQKTRKITHKTVWKMLSWAHYKFWHLIAKAEEFGVHIIIQNEAYTSKTCSWYEKIQKIEEFEMYNCWNCRIVIDWDENDAWKIFLWALLDEALILSRDYAGNSRFT